MKIDFFPRTIVTGDAFCNRTTDRKVLSKKLLMGRHMWIQAHRRHGKTSLVKQTILDIKKDNPSVYYERCHLLFNTSDITAIKKLYKSISDVSLKILMNEKKQTNNIERISITASSFYKRLNPNIQMTNGKINMSFGGEYTILGLLDALKNLDQLAQQFNATVIFMIDEFQEIGKLETGIEIESAIREVVETAEATTFIFCGSEATLMKQAMHSESRPLYKHTDFFQLQRIEEKHYIKHLTRLAKKEWGTELNKNTLKAITSLTKRHPYYINWLCGELWMQENAPNEHEVNATWQQIVQSVLREDTAKFTAMTVNERRVLWLVATGVKTSVASGKNSNKVSLGPSSVTQALKQLVRKAYIDKNSDGYYVVDPAIECIARRLH